MQFYEYILEGIFRIDEASNCVCQSKIQNFLDTHDVTMNLLFFFGKFDDRLGPGSRFAVQTVGRFSKGCRLNQLHWNLNWWNQLLKKFICCLIHKCKSKQLYIIQEQNSSFSRQNKYM